jgi:hypothetical protein
MSMIRPSFTENLHTTLFNLEADRPMYYLYVIRVGRSLFLSMGFHEEVTKIDKMIFETLEKPYKAPFQAIVEAFYNPRFMYTKQAYTRIGDSVDYVQVTRWEMRMKFEKIKDYIYDKATQYASLIRFTHSSNAMVQ